MKQSSQNVVNRSNVFENQPGVLNQSQISQTPFGVREIISSEYPKDSTVVKLISSNAPGAVTQVNTTYAQGSKYRSFNSQLTPPRQQRTIVRRSESPVRYITESISPGRSTVYRGNQIPISAVVKEQVPLYIIGQQPQTQYVQERVVEVEKPIYIEKIIEVNGESSEELFFLRDKVALLENNNRQLLMELDAARATPGQTTQVIVENTDRITELQREIERLRIINQDDQEKIKRSKPQNESQAELNKVRAGYEQQINDLIAQNQKLNELLASSQPENHNLTLQINQLRINNENRNKEYLEKINLLTAEIDRLTKSMKLSREQSDNEINRLNGLLNERNGQYNLQIVKIQELEQRITQLNAEVERLRQNQGGNVYIQQNQQREKELEALLVQKDNEINLLRLKLQEYQNLQGQFVEIERLNEQLRRQVEELSNRKVVTQEIIQVPVNNSGLDERVKLLSSQNDQLVRQQQNYQQETFLLRSRLEENEAIIRNSDDYEIKINKLLEQTANLNQLIAEKDREVQRLRNQRPVSDNSVEINELRRLLSEADQRCQQQELIIAQLQRRIEDMQANEELVKRSKKTGEPNLQAKLEECELNNVQLRGIVDDQRRQIANQEQSIILLTQQLERINLIVIEKDTELNRLRTEISTLQITVRNSGVSHDEVNRLNRLLQDKSNENDALRRRVSELEIAVASARQYEVKLVECERNNADLRTKIDQLISQLNEQIRTGSSSEYIKREKSQLEEKLVNLSVQLEMLNKKLQNSELEINNLRLRNAELENQLRSVSTYEVKINMLNEQINNLNLQIAQRDNDLNKLRLEIQQNHLHLRQSGVQKEETNRLNEQLNARTRENEELKARINELLLTIQRLQNSDLRIKDLENQVATLKRQNEDLLAQINDLNVETVKRSSKASQADLLLREKQMLEEKILTLNGQLDGAIRRSSQLEQEAATLRLQLSEQQSANQKLVYENTRLSEQLQLLAKDNENLRARISSFEQQIFALSNSERTIKDLQIRIDQLVAQNNGLSEDRIKLTRQISEYEIRLRSVQSLEDNITLLTRQNEALTLRLRQYEEEINKLSNLLTLIRRSVEEWSIVQTKVNGYASLVDSIKTAISTVQISSTSTVTRSYQV